MTTRCKAFFNGLEVQVEWEMTRSHGTVPDVGRLVFRQGGTLPSSFRGDLVLKYGETTVVTFRDCLLNRPQERFGRTRDIVYQIIDGRWKWKTPTVFGQYNVRDATNDLVIVEPDIRKNAQELALILLKALHAKELLEETMTEADFNVSSLPTDADLAPHVEWLYTSAAVELEKLCALFSCSVAPQNDGTIHIVGINTGDEPDNTHLKQPVETGLIINPAPDYVTAYASETLFESWLCLEPVGIDDEGSTIKPIAMLSYAPTGGWKNIDPKHGIQQAVRSKLRGTMTEERIDKVVEAASRSVFRMFRITGFGPGQQFFEGFTLEDPVDSPSSLPEVGDTSKVYRVNTADGSNREQRFVVWNGDEYVGVATRMYLPSDSATNPLGFFGYLYDPSKIAKLTDNPIVDYGGGFAVDQVLSLGGGNWRILRDDAGYIDDYKSDVNTLAAWQIASGNPKHQFVYHGGSGFDIRSILPLLGSRIETEIDGLGKHQRKKAEICGLFFEDDSYGRNRDADKNELKLWKKGFSIDNNTGIVTLSSPAWHRVAGYPQLWLKVGYRYRQQPYGNMFHRQYNKPTGSTLGVANAVIPRRDLNEYVVNYYSADYNQLHLIGTPIKNTTQIDAMLDATATEAVKQYQNTVAPKRKVYTPIRAIDLNGKVVQVSYSGGHDRLGETSASIGASYDIGQSPARKKALLEAQRRQVEENMLEFTDRRNQTLNVDQAPNIGNAFDASNIA